MIQAVVNFFKRFSFVARKTLKPDSSSSQGDIDPKNIPRMYYDRPGRRHSHLKSLRGSILDNSNKVNLNAEQILQQEQKSAATRIQRLIRGYIGRKRTKKLLQDAIDEASSYWRDYYEKIRMEKDKMRMAALEREKVAMSFVKVLFATVTETLVRFHAAITIQRVWRGYIVRRNPPEPHVFLTKKRVRLRRRFAHDTLRRVWVRRHYEPTGGWPGRFDVLHHDMWSHTDSPPQGRSYGLRTIKVHAVPHSALEETTLRSDVNAWYGLPVSVLSSEEARPALAPRVKALLQQSPYAQAIATPSPKTSKSSAAQLMELSRQSHVSCLESPPTLIAESRPHFRGARKPTTKTRYPTYRTNDLLTRDSSNHFGSEFSAAEHTVTGGDRLDRSFVGGTSFASTANNTATVTSIPSGSVYPSLAAGEVPLAAHWSAESRAIARKRTAAAASWTPSHFPNQQPQGDGNYTGDIMHRTGTAWGRMRTKAHVATCLSRPEGAGSRVRMWPLVTRRHYSLRYTWVPQTLVHDAVNKMYTQAQQDEEGDTLTSFQREDVQALRIPSLEEIEEEYQSKSAEYYSLESDLLSGDVRVKESPPSSSQSLVSSIYQPDFSMSGLTSSKLTIGERNTRLHHYHFL